MDPLVLLERARVAGLTVVADSDGEHLHVKGPKRAEPIVRELAANKPAVLAALTAYPSPVSPSPKPHHDHASGGFGDAAPESRPDVPDGWTPQAWTERLRYLAEACILPVRARELAAWADDVERWYYEAR